MIDESVYGELNWNEWKGDGRVGRTGGTSFDFRYPQRSQEAQTRLGNKGFFSLIRAAGENQEVVIAKVKRVNAIVT
jgi:hypothetical protein